MIHPDSSGQFPPRLQPSLRAGDVMLTAAAHASSAPAVPPNQLPVARAFAYPRAGGVALSVALCCLPASADGWGTLGGKTASGDYIGVAPCEHDPTGCSNPAPPNGFAVYIRKRGSQSEGEYFKSQRCEVTRNAALDVVRLTCIEGDSPLAGVTYRVSRNKNPKDCNHEYRYVCIEGCSKPGVPRVLLQGYWECAQK